MGKHKNGRQLSVWISDELYKECERNRIRSQKETNKTDYVIAALEFYNKHLKDETTMEYVNENVFAELYNKNLYHRYGGVTLPWYSVDKSGRTQFSPTKGRSGFDSRRLHHSLARQAQNYRIPLLANIYWSRGVFVCPIEDIHKIGYFTKKCYFADATLGYVTFRKACGEGILATS